LEALTLKRTVRLLEALTLKRTVRLLEALAIAEPCLFLLDTVKRVNFVQIARIEHIVLLAFETLRNV
jgi:hypothetical protein